MQKDKAGRPYTAAGNGPAKDGARVKIQTNNGPRPGTMRSGYVVPDRDKNKKT
jgi:hypothetical protein